MWKLALIDASVPNAEFLKCFSPLSSRTKLHHFRSQRLLCRCNCLSSDLDAIESPLIYSVLEKLEEWREEKGGATLTERAEVEGRGAALMAHSTDD